MSLCSNRRESEPTSEFSTHEETAQAKDYNVPEQRQRRYITSYSHTFGFLRRNVSKASQP